MARTFSTVTRRSSSTSMIAAPVPGTRMSYAAFSFRASKLDASAM